MLVSVTIITGGRTRNAAGVYRNQQRKIINIIVFSTKIKLDVFL